MGYEPVGHWPRVRVHRDRLHLHRVSFASDCTPEEEVELVAGLRKKPATRSQSESRIG